MKYEITDWELDGAKKIVEAPGIAEAMFEYLPWTNLEVEINWHPSNGLAVVVDNKTDFRYHVQAI
ncbi:MAG: hypothetical protein WC241_05015 [Candidatus Paceibacterota bacterium]|jgi:hypothetical protein